MAERAPTAASAGEARGDGDTARKKAGANAARCLSPTVLLVLGMFGFVYATVMNDVVLSPFLGGVQTAAGLFHTVLFSAISGMALLSYGLAVVRPPGEVPSDYEANASAGAEDGKAVHVEVKRKGGAPRFCQKCLQYKPPRTHHCRICRRCVLRMDHHCIWVGNCVGHNNYKAFFLFLAYTTAALVHALYLLVAYGIDAAVAHTAAIVDPAATARTVAQKDGLAVARPSMAGALALPLFIGVGSLFVWHARLVVLNKTTIEHHEGVRTRVSEGGTAGTRRHVYDVGAWSNVSAALGHSPSMWLVPWPGKAAGDGLSFPTASMYCVPISSS